MDKYPNWKEALSAFDTSSQIHGWAADMGTEKQALQARRDYERDKTALCEKILDLVAERDTLREALDLVNDLSSQEWQDQNGKRMAATGNDGKRFWFITDDVMRVVRAALAKEQGV